MCNYYGNLRPEALSGGNIAKIQNGDILELDLENGILHLHISELELTKRSICRSCLAQNEHGVGRELFTNFRANVTSAETGATSTF